MNGNNEGDITRDLGFTFLDGGTGIKVRAGGYSMYPSIRPGAIIYIEPLKEEEEPVAGEVLAWKRPGGLVVHRLVSISGNGSSRKYITRGDSCRFTDKPVGRTSIAGRVTMVENAEGNILCKGTPKRKYCYFYNRMLVYIILKIKRLLRLLMPMK